MATEFADGRVAVRAAVRAAGAADVPELVRLRAVMLAAMGEDVAAGEWQPAAAAALALRLADPQSAVLVIEAEQGGRGGGGAEATAAAPLAATGIGWIQQHLPAPRNPDGRRGFIANMSTDPALRRRGYGRAVLEALLAWFAGQGIGRVDLYATADGAPLYRAAGFGELSAPALTVRPAPRGTAPRH